jgi:hypothetical protein
MSAADFTQDHRPRQGPTDLAHVEAGPGEVEEGAAAEVLHVPRSIAEVAEVAAAGDV